MRFWDSSAIVPLLVDEPSSEAIGTAFESDPQVLVWWATQIECVSALTRLERTGDLTEASLIDALGRLGSLAAAWSVVGPVERVRQMAIRHLRVHPLRAGDALQLAAATVGAEEEPSSLGFVTLDDQLASAAIREGFVVLRPGADLAGAAEASRS